MTRTCKSHTALALDGNRIRILTLLFKVTKLVLPGGAARAHRLVTPSPITLPLLTTNAVVLPPEHVVPIILRLMFVRVGAFVDQVDSGPDIGQIGCLTQRNDMGSLVTVLLPAGRACRKRAYDGYF
jgi:hypothetical protein